MEQEQSDEQTTGKNHLAKKVVIKSRILRPNENLFVLAHVWNQMKLERKDGFRNAKLILTKKQPPTLPPHMTGRKPVSLLKHRFSLQPRPSTTTHTQTTTMPTAAAIKTSTSNPKSCSLPPVEQPVESKPVESKPVESKPVESKPVESKPVESKPVEQPQQKPKMTNKLK